jgi:flagellar hook assembly protein FlgD
VDAAPLPGCNVYLVRAAKLETTASGTYYDLSPGAIDSTFTATDVEDTRLGAWLRSYPNPTATATNIAFRLAAPGRAVLRIHDVAGRLVRTIDAGPRPAGVHVMSWDGRDAEGRRAASGIYYLSLHADHATLSTKIVKVE